MSTDTEIRSAIRESQERHHQAWSNRQADFKEAWSERLKRPVPPVHVPVEHRHTRDSGCLKEAPEVPYFTKAGTMLVPQAGWLLCEPLGLLIHEHGDRLYSHVPEERQGCPIPLPPESEWRASA